MARMPTHLLRDRPGHHGAEKSNRVKHVTVIVVSVKRATVSDGGSSEIVGKIDGDGAA